MSTIETKIRQATWYIRFGYLLCAVITVFIGLNLIRGSISGLIFDGILLIAAGSCIVVNRRIRERLNSYDGRQWNEG